MSQATALAETPLGRLAVRDRLLASLHRQGVVILLLVLGTFASVRHESFLTPENLFNVLRQNSMPGLLALGMTFVILSGGIDLSVGALLAVGGVTAAALSPYGSVVAVLGAMATTALLGCANGVGIACARVQPFITTLVMGMAARGVLLALTQERSVRVAGAAAGLKWLGRGWVAGVPMPVVQLLLAYVAAWVILGHTRFGRHVHAVGDNDEAARLLGLNVDRVRVGAYAVSGALAGWAGVLLAARIGVGQPVAGMGWELTAITAVVVGGTSLGGGQGDVIGTLLGLLLLAVTFNVFNLEGSLSTYWQWVLRGVLLLLVVVVQNRLEAAGKAGEG